MATLPAADSSTPLTSSRHWPAPRTTAGLASLLAAFGVVSIWSTALFLWSLWVTDPLKSIGMFVPVVSFVLILRAWRGLGWEMQGSWWGLALLVVTAAAVRFREQSILVLVVSPRWNVYFPPHSLVAFAYVSGVVLLFGGRKLYRAALFPVLLIWLVNPVPHIFNVFVDLPLQRVSAHVARTFAIALHQPLTADQMRLMFTPDFGMFIAPGCNGIRGAVTMGMIALIVGHLYRFRAPVHAAFVAGAVLLGYIFNFVRLCTLVLYYIVALHVIWLQSRAEMGDYVIGACLFFAAVWLLFLVVRRAARLPADAARDAPVSREMANIGSAMYLRLGAMLVLVLLSGSRLARALYAARSGPAAATAVPAATFPGQLGAYARTRSWQETMTGGAVIFDWAQYSPSPAGRGAPAADDGSVAVGVSPVLGSHDTSICHSARGEDPVWHEQMTTLTADGVPISFSASFFNSGVRQYLELSTVCNGERCGEYSTGAKHLGLIYSRPAPRSVFAQSPERPIPVMLTNETLDTAIPADLARDQLLSSMRRFLAGVRVEDLTRPYRGL